MAIGLLRAGPLGLLAAWSAFTLPSAIALVGFAYGVEMIGTQPGTGWIQGLKAAAVAVVALAVYGMARTLTPDRRRATIAVAGMVAAMLAPTAIGQVLVIAAAGLAGLVWLTPPKSATGDGDTPPVPIGRRTAVACLTGFVLLLAALPLLAAATGNGTVRLFDGFYRAGSLVFGGGHVVLPLLQAETVQTGLVDRDTFLAGYGAAQAVPGPLFTLAAYLGAVMNTPPAGVAAAAIALLAIFLPSALLIAGTLPFWQRLRHSATAQRALMGVNAGVVGLLAAALYDPVFTEGITSPTAMAIAAAAFVALAVWKTPAWAVVITAGLIGFVAL